MIGRQQDAEAAYSRSLHRFELLAAQHPSDADYRYELARTIALDDQDGVDASEPERSEVALRKGIAIVEGLSEQAPDKLVYAAALARWNARLAGVIDQLGRPDEAVACYRESIARDEWLAGRVRHPGVRWVLSWNRGALARLLLRVGRRDEARPMLEQVNTYLRSVATAGRPLRDMGVELAERLESLADSFEELGDDGRAADLRARAMQVGPRSRQDHHDPGSDGPGPPSDGRHRPGGPPSGPSGRRRP